MTSTRLIAVADILKPHGVRGLLKLRPLVEDISLLTDKAGCMCDRHAAGPVQVTLKSKDGPFILVSLDVCPDRTSAEKFAGGQLLIPRERLDSDEGADEDTIYLTDLIDMPVVDQDGAALGIVTDIQNFGASDLLEITPKAGKSFYVPVDDDYITIEDGQIIARNFDVFRE
jgi:16S rRNA processing protein RimM